MGLGLCGMFCALLGVPPALAGGALRPMQLRCEYLVAPLGIATDTPRLSWVCQSTRPAARGLSQTAYQVVAASTREALDREPDLWDTGRVDSSDPLGIQYAGKPLSSRQQVWWKVRLWDQDGQSSDWSRPATWTMGIIGNEPWHAQWIAGVQDGTAMPIFRREFTLDRMPERAVVRICGLGHYELRVNGTPVTHTLLDPGWTNYRLTCPYDTYDVTPLLRRGANALALMLGNGMYNVPGGRYVKFTGSFGEPKAIAELALDEGSRGTRYVGTGRRWRTTSGPIVFSCTYGGEDYDARRDPPGWDRPGFDDHGWRAARVVEGPGGTLRPRRDPPLRVQRTLEPVAIRRIGSGTYVYDLGQNSSSMPRIAVAGPAGRTVRLTPGELVNPDGTVTQASSGGPMWFEYTLRGSGIEVWSPRFTYYGFRYVQIDGAAPADSADEPDDLPRIHSLQGQFLWSDVPPTGRFECSNPDVARIRHLIGSAIRSNLKSVLTDCPHREKLGWLEVPHLLGQALMYNFDLGPYFAKIAQDTTEAQTPEGLVPDIAPEYVVFSGGFRDSPEWGSACIIAPWISYLFHGDRRVLEDNYETMKRYVAYLGTKANRHIVSHGLGDWYDVGPGPNGPSQLTAIALTATALYYQDIDTLAKIARALGRADDAQTYSALGADVREAFNDAFLHANEGYYDRDSQTANAMPLVLGLVDPNAREAVLQRLARGIRDRGDRITAGDIGFSYVVRALTDGDRGDVLYDMIVQDKGPGYIHQLRQGATSLIEAWDANRGASQNHCMLGHAEEWFYRGAAGIRVDESHPGFSHFTLRPQMVRSLDWVRAEYDSVRGTIGSSWTRTGRHIAWTVTIPPNSSATVWVPARGRGSVTEGGRPATGAPGLTFSRFEDGCAVFEAVSGTYRLESVTD